MSVKATVRLNEKNINVTVTSKAAVIEKWVADMMQQYGCSSGGPKVVVGVETERKPGPSLVDDGDDIFFDSEWVSQPTINDYNNNKVATFQLCIDTNCLIIQLIYLDYMPQCLMDFLRSQNFIFVGVNIAEYTAPVMSDYRMVWNMNIEDLLYHMMQKDPRKCFMWGGWPSIKKLAKEVVGLDIAATDHIRIGDWEIRDLSNDQIVFACFEAYASYVLGCNFFLGS